MKKVFVLLLAFFIVLPLSVFADQDPIVGTWYVYSGIMESASIDPPEYIEFHIFHFTSDGSVFSSKYIVSKEGDTIPTDFHVIALWTNENGRYYINMGLKGPQEISIENDTLFFPVTDSYSIRIHKMTEINYVMDMKK